MKTRIRFPSGAARRLALGLLVAAPASLAPAQTPIPADFGDAPDGTHGFVWAYPLVPGHFPSFLRSEHLRFPETAGIWHHDVSAVWIGGHQSALSTTTKELDAKVLVGDEDDGAILLLSDLSIGPDYETYGLVVVKSGLAMQQTCFLNVVIDLNRDGQWRQLRNERDEWVVRNLEVVLDPMQAIVVHTDPFWAPHQGPFWVRTTLSDVEIDPSVYGEDGWDGSGPDAGFAFGETEDHLVYTYDANDGWGWPPSGGPPAPSDDDPPGTPPPPNLPNGPNAPGGPGGPAGPKPPGGPGGGPPPGGPGGGPPAGGGGGGGGGGGTDPTGATCRLVAFSMPTTIVCPEGETKKAELTAVVAAGVAGIHPEGNVYFQCLNFAKTVDSTEPLAHEVTPPTGGFPGDGVNPAHTNVCGLPGEAEQFIRTMRATDPTFDLQKTLTTKGLVRIVFASGLNMGVPTNPVEVVTRDVEIIEGGCDNPTKFTILSMSNSVVHVEVVDWDGLQTLTPTVLTNCTFTQYYTSSSGCIMKFKLVKTDLTKTAFGSVDALDKCGDKTFVDPVLVTLTDAGARLERVDFGVPAAEKYLRVTNAGVTWIGVLLNGVPLLYTTDRVAAANPYDFVFEIPLDGSADFDLKPFLLPGMNRVWAYAPVGAGQEISLFLSDVPAP
ncbi:MAG: hypothetical protein HY812_00545 [Planctomycetes bacterium]|nr:hypothetical protein [Planctomycetota bacterium]